MKKRRCHMLGALLMSFNLSTYAGVQRCGKDTGQSEPPAKELREILRVSAGGPYRTAVGEPITLHGTYKIAGQTEDMDHLQAIGRALQAYLSANGTYPPAALLNDKGQATVSWRVLILPYLGHKALYDRFDLRKPWNDPANAHLLRAMPAEYRGAGCSDYDTDTAYAGVQGTNSLFEKAATQLNGGHPAANIFQTQALGAGRVGKAVRIPWTAPDDIDASSTTRLGSDYGFSGGHDFTPLTFLDGTVHLLPNNDGSILMQTWIDLSAPLPRECVCAPPSVTDVGLRAAWDLRNRGTLTGDGFETKFVATKAGTYTVVLHVFDRFQNHYTSAAKVEVK
jgi:hypothetical protein